MFKFRLEVPSACCPRPRSSNKDKKNLNNFGGNFDEKLISIVFTTKSIVSCNIRPEDTYRRKIKLSPKTPGQRLNRALHAFRRLYQASTFGGLSNIGSTKTLLLSASVKTLKLT